jgi:hypothetical protein
MNSMPPNLGLSHLQLRKLQAVSVLERVCEQLDPTANQLELAEQHYSAVARWVAEAEHPPFSAASIYAQGSFAIGTTNKPIGHDDIDVDLVAHFPSVTASIDPRFLKALLGDRLKAHDVYKSKLREMPRCWRIDYANYFHLDITPSIPNRACPMGGELVPDKTLECWKTSNPRGFRDLFAKRAALRPRVRMAKSLTTDRARAHVQPFPEYLRFKGVLRRIVQLAKRHRDMAFVERDQSLRPISVVITTLVSRAYEVCVHRDYDTELDLAVDVIRLMPHFIERHDEFGRQHWAIWNQTTIGENFAEKWNSDSRRAHAFFGWHGAFLHLMEQAALQPGTDVLRKSLRNALGSDPVERAFGVMTGEVQQARRIGTLLASPTAGLLVSACPIVPASPVRPNTFFGA